MKKHAAKKRAVKKSKSALPVSTATNAYELLRDVRKAILEEPKRYFQDAWRLKSHDIRRRAFARPACGTVCCVAGWITTLNGDRRKPTEGYWKRASDILGFPNANDTLSLVAANAVSGKPQTLAYARRGAKHILDFMKSHKDRLLAKAI